MITDIVLGNFLSYKQAHMRIQAGQLNVIIGRNTSDYGDSNGSGKTSLLKALLWAFYGRFPGQESADSVVNKTVKKDTEVRVYFEKNGVKYVVARYRKHQEHRNNVYLWEGSGQHAGDVKDVQEKIVSAIGMDYEVFLATLVFTGEREDEFAGGTDKEQKKVLNALLPMAFESAFRKASDKVETLRQEADALGREIQKYELMATQAADRIQTHEQGSHDWVLQENERRIDLEQRLREEETTLRTLQAEASPLAINNTKWESTLNEHAKLLQELSVGKESLNTRLITHTALLRELEHAKSTVTRLEAEQVATDAEDRRVMGKWQNEEVALFQEIEALDKAAEKHCPTCGQTIADEALARTLAKLQAESANLRATMESTRAGLASRLNELREQAHKAQTLREELQARADESARANGSVQEELAGIDAKIQAARDKHQEVRQGYDAHRAYYAQWKSRVAASEERIKSMKSDLETPRENPYPALQAREEEARKTAEAEGARARENLSRVSRETRHWETVKTMFSGGKGGLHHFLFEQVLPEMTAMAQMFLNFFSANTLKVAFRSHKKSGNKIVEGFFVDADRGNVKGYGNLSRGEQRRINVAISLTLYLMASKHVFNPGILFLDEVADSLDQSGKQSIIELLEHFCSQYQSSAVLLTNERELLANVHHGYEAVMHDGISRLSPISES